MINDSLIGSSIEGGARCAQRAVRRLLKPNAFKTTRSTAHGRAARFGRGFLAGGLLMIAASARAAAIEEITIADLHAGYREGRLTVHEVVAAYIARIAAY